MTISQRDINELLIAERRIFRTVLGTVKTESNGYRNRKQDESQN